MLSYEQAQEALTDIADSFPSDIYNELTGGIIIMPEYKLSTHALGNDLFTMGDYNHDQLGRYIRIYYGSFLKVYPGASDDELVGHMDKVLRHELLHHLEGLAGDKSLERQDEDDLENYYHSYDCHPATR